MSPSTEQRRGRERGPGGPARRGDGRLRGLAGLRRRTRSLPRRLLRDASGQEIIELVLVTPILLIVLFGTIELGHAFDVAHALTDLAREGANIASRGAALDTVLDVTLRNGGTVDLTDKGGVVVSEVTVQSDGTPRIVDQVSGGSEVRASRYGIVNDPAAGLGSLGLSVGRTVYIVEVFFSYDPLTPLGQIVPDVVPSVIYDRALF